MVEEGFKTAARELIENWRNERTPLNAGATEDELLALEKRFASTLPPDFRYFYSLANGMTDYESDKYFFSLWPLEWIATEIERGRSLLEEGGEEASGEGGENPVCSAVFSLFRDFSVAQKKPRPVERIRDPFAFCKIEIPFGDVMIDSYRYRLCQDKEGRFSVYWEGAELLADSFGHFLLRYLTEPEKIYLYLI